MKQLKQQVVLIRHGETEWAREGRHTSFTDLPLTELGRQQAQMLYRKLQDWNFSAVFCSPLQRARQTCQLAGLQNKAEQIADLTEWHYGRYEGLTTKQIQAQTPHWDLFSDGCPDGETPQQVAQRLDRVIARVRDYDGDVAVFSHGHALRVFATRWIGQPVENAHMFVLDTATLNILGSYHDAPAIVTWNSAIQP